MSYTYCTVFVTGFTTGIALIIFSSQIGDLLGLSLAHVPGDVVGIVRVLFAERRFVVRDLVITQAALAVLSVELEVFAGAGITEELHRAVLHEEEGDDDAQDAE